MGLTLPAGEIQMANRHELQEVGAGIPIMSGPIDLNTTALEVDALVSAGIRGTNGVVRSRRVSHSSARLVMFNANPGERRYWVRSYVPKRDGSGFWDIYKVAEDLMVMICEFEYNEDRWIAVPGERCFKIRFVESGELLDKNGESFLQKTQSMFEVYPGECGDGYLVSGKVPCRLVVVHAANSVLSEKLGVIPESAPMPIKLLADDDAEGPYIRRFRPASEMERAFTELLDSRDLLEPNLRGWFVESKAKEIIVLLLQSMLQEPDARVGANVINRRDRQRVREVREIILAKIDDVPSIPELARMVGTNQTKLKVGFKELIGVTIGQFVLQRKMELAAKLLTSTDLVISQISHSLGYRHSGNFAQAFKRYFGQAPRDYRQVVDLASREHSYSSK